jgi:hypothetical protein
MHGSYKTAMIVILSILMVININKIFLLNNFFNFICKTSLNICIVFIVGFMCFLSMEINFYVSLWDSLYDKILKTHEHFQNIKINIVFLLNFYFILLYIQNTVKYLQFIRCGFCVSPLNRKLMTYSHSFF